MMKPAHAVLTMVVAGILPSACDQGHAGGTPAGEVTRPTLPARAVPTVELTEAQQSAIQIQPVGTHPFFVDREAVGAIGFDEDLPIVQAEATLIGAAATFTLTGKELTRLQALGEANGIAQKDLDQAIADHRTAAGALKAARDVVRALGKTDSQIDRIIASGRSDRAAVRGAAKWVVANVSESDSPLLRVGQAVAVKVTAYPDRVYAGRVSRIYATVDPDTHRMTTRALVLDPKDELRPGMLANITIRISGPVDSLAVPATAVVREGDGTMVAWVTSDRRHFIQRPLKLGPQVEGRYQVLEGLQTGELLVVDGGVFLSNLFEAPPSD